MQRVKRFASIITSLNERHILTQKQKPFRPNSLHSVLCNRKYIGEYRYKDIIIPDGVPSIIPKALFEMGADESGKEQKDSGKGQG